MTVGALAENPQMALGSFMDFAGVTLGQAEKADADNEQDEESSFQLVLAARSHVLDNMSCFHDADNQKFAIDAAHDVMKRTYQATKSAALAPAEPAGRGVGARQAVRRRHRGRAEPAARPAPPPLLALRSHRQLPPALPLRAAAHLPGAARVRVRVAAEHRLPQRRPDRAHARHPRPGDDGARRAHGAATRRIRLRHRQLRAGDELARRDRALRQRQRAARLPRRRRHDRVPQLFEERRRQDLRRRSLPRPRHPLLDDAARLGAVQLRRAHLAHHHRAAGAGFAHQQRADGPVAGERVRQPDVPRQRRGQAARRHGAAEPQPPRRRQR